MMRFSLPFPPSVWDIYEGWGKGRHRTPSYNKWRSDAGWMIRGVKQPISVPVNVHITLKRPNKRCDIDNFSKACLDVLEHYDVITNDKLCERLTMRWHDGPEECLIFVEAA